eukprot:14080810-Heterocapsa_arctica.AAC.1
MGGKDAICQTVDLNNGLVNTFNNHYATEEFYEGRMEYEVSDEVSDGGRRPLTADSVGQGLHGEA